MTPESATMALVGLLALTVNVSVAALLYTFRDGDASMKSVWLCSRNDAIGNLAVMLAAAGVFGTGALWPDVAVAVVLGALGLSAGRNVIVQAWRELDAGGPRKVALARWMRIRVDRLELKVQPPALTATSAAVVVAFVGLALAVRGVIDFRSAGTTVDPRHPARSTRIVPDGL